MEALNLTGRKGVVVGIANDTPTSLTVGIGKSAENGILIRSGDAL